MPMPRNPAISLAQEEDFRSPEFPTDRVLVLEAVMAAKGHKLPAPPTCHGYINCCRCPACLQREHPAKRRLAAA